MQATEVFKTQVKEAWALGSKAVAEAALNELFRHGDSISLDSDDQVSHAMSVGILAGETRMQGPEIFIGRFENEVLN